MGKYLLGEFEHLVLLAILGLAGDAYGVSITDALTERTGKDVAQAAVYLTLARLDEKGWVEGREQAGSERRGGRAKRVYRVTEPGLERLRSARATLESLWADAEGALG